MLDVINIRQKLPKLDQITNIKWVLPINNNKIIIVGYSNQSISNMQYVYEVFDFKEQLTIVKGRINNFGIIFLSEYVVYKQQGDFLILCQSLGTRKIIQQNFIHGVTSTLIKEIQKPSFQQNSKKQWSCLHYSQNHDKIYLLQIFEFSKFQSNLYFRVFKQDLQVSSYRLICLQHSIPKIIFSPQHILCLYDDEFVLYKQNFEQIDFQIQNMEQFKIIGFFYEMILQFKENKSIFSMSINGTLRPLLQQSVVSFHINQSLISFLYLKNLKYRVASYQYKNKTLVLKCDIDANILKSTMKSGCFKIINSNRHQILINDIDFL